MALYKDNEKIKNGKSKLWAFYLLISSEIMRTLNTLFVKIVLVLGLLIS